LPLVGLCHVRIYTMGLDQYLSRIFVSPYSWCMPRPCCCFPFHHPDLVLLEEWYLWSNPLLSVPVTKWTHGEQVVSVHPVIRTFHFRFLNGVRWKVLGAASPVTFIGSFFFALWLHQIEHFDTKVSYKILARDITLLHPNHPTSRCEMRTFLWGILYG
jgi:hypothetical protein